VLKLAYINSGHHAKHAESTRGSLANRLADSRLVSNEIKVTGGQCTS